MAMYLGSMWYTSLKWRIRRSGAAMTNFLSSGFSVPLFKQWELLYSTYVYVTIRVDQ